MKADTLGCRPHGSLRDIRVIRSILRPTRRGIGCLNPPRYMQANQTPQQNGAKVKKVICVAKVMKVIRAIYTLATTDSSRRFLRAGFSEK